MLSVREHIEKGKHNENFLGSFDVDKTPFLDWVVTGYFYAALHYLGAYFKTQGQQPSRHPYTDTLMLKDSNLDAIYNDYLDLKNDSEEARYGSRTFTPVYVRNFCQSKLSSIKQHLQPFLQP